MNFFGILFVLQKIVIDQRKTINSIDTFEKLGIVSNNFKKDLNYGQPRFREVVGAGSFIIKSSIDYN